jgi:hypothetical protein
MKSRQGVGGQTYLIRSHSSASTPLGICYGQLQIKHLQKMETNIKGSMDVTRLRVP